MTDTQEHNVLELKTLILTFSLSLPKRVNETLRKQLQIPEMCPKRAQIIATGNSDKMFRQIFSRRERKIFVLTVQKKILECRQVCIRLIKLIE
jgi:hypothetical protein